MNLRVSILSAMSVMVAACAPAATMSEGETNSSDQIAAARLSLEKLAEDGFSGSVLVACNSEILLHSDYGLAPHEPATVRYEVASVTKGLTAIVILKLAEEGKLTIEDRLDLYFPTAPADKAGITLFEVLTHQSGLPQNYAAEGKSDRNAAVAAILAQPLKHQPRAQFSYSNDNYSLLAIVSEFASGETYKSLVARIVTDPLDMETIAFWPDRRRSGEYMPPLLIPFSDSDSDIDWGFLGGHGARLSVAEMHLIAMGVKYGKLINSNSRELVFGPHVNSVSGLGVGMGWFRETTEVGRQVLWMSGYDMSGGNATMFFVGENGLAIAAATNAGPDEDAGPGWSRVARDALIEVFAPLGASDYCAGTASGGR